MNKEENVTDAVKLLDDNKLKLVKLLTIELSELGMPFILDEDNNPQVFSDEHKGMVNAIYAGVCAKFIYKNNIKE